jgi:hypothetical protein
MVQQKLVERPLAFQVRAVATKGETAIPQRQREEGVAAVLGRGELPRTAPEGRREYRPHRRGPLRTMEQIK